ncbi:MAG TPA: DUF3618 domain-containing protein, partial [Euzebyales bacterium]|nr:DUF3618 domain-containing protein [Euzebyales bacterium]
DPALIRRDIDRTRGDMEDTIDAINDRVNPRRIRERRVNRIRRRWTSMRDSVRGSSSGSSADYSYPYGDYGDYGDERGSGLRDRFGNAGDTVGSHAGDARETISSRAGDAREAVGERVGQARQAVSDAPERVQQQTRGNPLTVGMIAFGVGALIGSALPDSEAERRAARAAADHVDVDGAKERLTEAAREVQSGVQDKAREAAQDLKGSAREAAQDVKGQAQQEGKRVKEDAQESGQQVRRQA